MSSQLANIINESISKDLSYLELGCYIKTNFNRVKFSNKECVDINKEFDPTYCMTTDLFFSQNKKRYDMIFIDANHNLDYVVSDCNNASDICNNVIVIHDMFPPNEEQTSPGYCSDSFKFLYYLTETKAMEYYTLNEDCGLTFIFPRFRKVNIHDIKQVSYSDFLKLNPKTYNKEELINILKNKL